MISIPRLLEVFDFNPDTGLFIHKANRTGLKKSCVGKVAGYKTSEGYLMIKVDGQAYTAHRLVWFATYMKWPEFEIDHINGIKDDNRICNLRDVPRNINSQNLRSSMKKISVEAPLGVSWHAKAKKWRGMIWDGKRNIYLGLFEKAEDAHQEYLRAKRVMHKGCTI